MQSFHTAWHMQPLLMRVLLLSILECRAVTPISHCWTRVPIIQCAFSALPYLVNIIAPPHTKCQTYQHATSAQLIHSVLHVCA